MFLQLEAHSNGFDRANTGGSHDAGTVVRG
jgi:hypothetical protein